MAAVAMEVAGDSMVAVEEVSTEEAVEVSTEVEAAAFMAEGVAFAAGAVSAVAVAVFTEATTRAGTLAEVISADTRAEETSPEATAWAEVLTAGLVPPAA